MDQKSRTTASQAGWMLDEYARLIAVTRAYIYALAPELQARSVTFASRRVIIDLSAAYLARIAVLQAQGGVAA